MKTILRALIIAIVILALFTTYMARQLSATSATTLAYFIAVGLTAPLLCEWWKWETS